MLKRCLLVFAMFFISSIVVFAGGGTHSASEVMAGTFGSQNTYEIGTNTNDLKLTMFDNSTKVTVSGLNKQPSGKAVEGFATSSTGSSGIGVYGVHDSSGIGVKGKSLSSGVGVYGQSVSGYGIQGESTSNYGVYGSSSSDIGVVGISGSSAGVYGGTTSGYSGYFEGGKFVVVSGNVGVGTTSPSQKLDVIGYVRGSSGLCISSDCRTSWPTGGIVSESDPQVGAITSSYLPKWDGSALVTGTIYDNGNIGIGTAAPGEKLELSSGKLYFSDSATFGPPTSNSNYRIRLGPWQTNSLNEYGMGIDSASLWLTAYDNIRFYTHDGTTQKLRATVSDSYAYFSQDVGVGTTSPRGMVEIKREMNTPGSNKPGLYVDTLSTGSTNYDSFSSVIRNGFGGSGSHGGLYIESGSQSSWPTIRAKNTDGAFNIDIGVSDTNLIGHEEYGVKVTGTPTPGWTLGSAAGYFQNGNTGNNNYAILADGNVKVTGKIGTSGKSPNSGYPSGWGGGIHTWDVYAEGTVGAGPENGPAKAYMDRDGNIVGVSKNFVIDHPSKEGYKLVHGTLEGPESAVFYRGESQLASGKAIIFLPDYFESLTRVEGRTVLLTPKFEGTEPISNLASSQVKDGKFSVRGIDSNNPSQKFFWEVKGVRSDIPELVVERISD